MAGVQSRLVVSFKVRNFRYLWVSDAFIGVGEQMEFVVLAWFVLQETDSPFLLGVYAALRFTGTLLSPLYGILVDRYERRVLLFLVRAAFAVNATAIMLLAFADLLQVWHVLIFAGVSGLGRAFDTITRQTLIPDIVAPSSLMNAVALSRSGRDFTQIAGPVIGAYVLTVGGTGFAYIGVVAAFAVSAALSLLLDVRRTKATGVGVSVLGNLRQAVSYVRREELILALLLMAFIVNLTGFPLNNGLMPVFARDVLGTGPNGLGQLLGAYSLGSAAGSATIAGLARFGRPGRAIVLAAIGWHGTIVVLAGAQWFGPALVVLAVVGFAQSFIMVTMAMTLLGATSPEIRGRVMGLRSLAVYGLPVGLLASGAMADTFGVSVALLINGSVGVTVAIAISLRLRRLWTHG